MPEATLDELTQRALGFDVLTPEQLQELWGGFGTQKVDVQLFLQETLRRGFLTNYQIERLLSGESVGFFYGDYKVLYRVGAGTFARVFRATHRTTGKFAAVKVLRNRFCDNPTVIDHFVHEAELGIDLRHPNIVPIYEVFSSGKDHYMVMDFVEGQTLREFLKTRKKADPKVSTRIMMDICSGLDYASKRGSQHRDLKLSNVLLSSMGKAMLVDFGLASVAEKGGSGNTEFRSQRSIDYAVLERMSGVRRDDLRSDIFFLGCIYYHLLCGEAPLLETKDRIKRADKSRFYNIKPIQQVDPSVPFALQTIVNRAMSLDPEKRYQTMGAVLEDLEVCARRLAEGTANDGAYSDPMGTGFLRPAPSASKDKQKCLMIVESNAELQNIFRETLKKAGYRTLLAASAERAVDRLFDDNTVADLVIFNAQYLGRAALEGYHKLAMDRYTANTPMILLLDERQRVLLNDVQREKHHLVLTMPVTLGVLKENVARLLSEADAEKGDESSPGSHLESVPELFAVPTEETPVFEEIDPQVSGTDVFAVPDRQTIGTEPAPLLAYATANDPEEAALFADDHEEDDEEEDEIESVASRQSLEFKKIVSEYRESGPEERSEPNGIPDELYDFPVPDLVRRGEPLSVESVSEVPAPGDPASDEFAPDEAASDIDPSDTEGDFSETPILELSDEPMSLEQLRAEAATAQNRLEETTQAEEDAFLLLEVTQRVAEECRLECEDAARRHEQAEEKWKAAKSEQSEAVRQSRRKTLAKKSAQALAKELQRRLAETEGEVLESENPADGSAKDWIAAEIQTRMQAALAQKNGNSEYGDGSVKASDK